jgi:hypothetical protein
MRSLRWSWVSPFRFGRQGSLKRGIFSFFFRPSLLFLLEKQIYSALAVVYKFLKISVCSWNPYFRFLFGLSALFQGAFRRIIHQTWQIGNCFWPFYGPFIASPFRKLSRMKDFSAFSCAHSGDFEWVLSVSEGREVKKLRDFHFFRLSGVSDGGSEDLIAGDLQIRMNAARLNDCWFKRLMVYLTNDRRIYVCVPMKSACPNRLL